MAIEGIGGITSQVSNTASQTMIGQEDLIKIMLAELRYQDPLKPLDNAEFISQLAQFTSLEQTKQLNDKVDTMMSLQAANQSIGLIGRNVEVATMGSTTESGQVTTITFRDGQPRLTVKTAAGAFLTDIGLSSVTLVR